MYRQLIVTRRSKPGGKTFFRVDFVVRFPTDCPKFPRILRCLILYKAKINNNKSTDKFQNSTVSAFFKDDFNCEYLIRFTMNIETTIRSKNLWIFLYKLDSIDFK